jgi:hypothetical protein
MVALGALACPAQAVLVTTYNTGTTVPVPVSTLAAPGSVDANYARVVFPLSGGGLPLGAADVATFVPTTWLAAGGLSGWIKPAFNYDGTLPSTFGTSYYQTAFDLTGLNTATAVFSGRWATDNALGRIYLNGVDLTAAGGVYNTSFPGSWSPFSIAGFSVQSNLVAGLNYLTFEVTNAPGPIFNPNTGLRVEYGGDALPVPEPASYALLAAGVAAIGFARRRHLDRNGAADAAALA